LLYHFGEIESCTVTADGREYDLSGLQHHHRGWTVDSKEYSYFLNFCEEVPSPHQCEGTACQYKGNGLVATLAKWPPRAYHDTDGVLNLQFTNGAPCTGAGPRVTTIKLPCGSNPHSTLELISDTNAACSVPGYSFKYETCYACDGGCNPVSTGTMFLFLLVLFASCYIGIGCWYNAKYNQMTLGSPDAIPQYQFWRFTLPALVIDGCRYSLVQATKLYGGAKQKWSEQRQAGVHASTYEKGEGTEKQGLLGSEEQDAPINASSSNP